MIPCVTRKAHVCVMSCYIVLFLTSRRVGFYYKYGTAQAKSYKYRADMILELELLGVSDLVHGTDVVACDVTGAHLCSTAFRP